MSEPERRSDDRTTVTHPAPLPRRAWLIRFVFLLVILAIIPNYLYREQTNSDWYPSLLMPRFAGALCDAQGRFKYQRIELVFSFTDGTSETMSPAELLPEVSVTQAQAIVRRSFINYPPRPEPRESLYGRTPREQWLREHIIPGYVQGRLRREFWAGVDPRSLDWLREVLRQRYPGRTPTRLVIRVAQEVMTERDASIDRRILYEEEVAL